MKMLAAFIGGLAVVSLVGCAADKSSNPLTPTVAGPIPGVNITAPNVLAPQATKIDVDSQPVTLLIENASTSGVRPLLYVFELAADVSFTNIVFRREDITPGEGGRTSVKLPDRLAPERTYYWRSRAQDGANTGPFSPPAHFDVFTPVVLGPPTPVAPINNELVNTLRPTFKFNNAPRTGPAGPISYLLEISESDTFLVKATATIGEQPNQTTFDPPEEGKYNKQYFWHVRAQEATTVGPWSAIQVFRTPAPPAPAPPDVPSPGANSGLHVGPGPLSEDRARQVVNATAKEFPGLTAVFDSDEAALGAARELLLRIIWHLHLAGYEAGRQKNPSGAISDDKMTIKIDGSTWHTYDVMSLGFRGRATTIQFIDVGAPNPQPENGIPD